MSSASLKWYYKNREQQLAKQAAYRKANSEKVAAYHKEWYQKNRVEVLAKQAAYDSAHPEKRKARERKWYLVNRERVIERGRYHNLTPRQKALKVAAVRRRQALQAKQHCSCCTKEQFAAIYIEARRLGLEVDHTHPLSKGGKHCVSNLQLLTRVENRRKHAKVVEKWR